MSYTFLAMFMLIINTVTSQLIDFTLILPVNMETKDFLEEKSPDILCLQETKVEDNLFPKDSIEASVCSFKKWGHI